MSDSLDRIRRDSSADAVHRIVMPIMEMLKSSGREDLCLKFTNDLSTILSERNLTKGPTASSAGDNLNEENMEVDDEQDDKHKKQLDFSEFNDVDYRFLDQDTDHRMIPSIISDTDAQNDRRNIDLRQTSHFSNVIPGNRDADDRTIKENKEKGTIMMTTDSDFRTGGIKRTSPK